MYMMDVRIASKKLIKPSVPTPNHLQNLSISYFDQYIYPTTVPVIFYYPANVNHPTETVERQNRLEKSLSEILSLYYPLAGRYINEKLIVDCNDEGIEYFEALVDGQLSQILRGKVEAKELNHFVPDHVEESTTSPLMAVQISIFNCGGIAVGIRFSHRIMDAFTCSLFVNGWAKACKLGMITDVIATPNFESGILFPTRVVYDQQKIPTGSNTISRPKVVTRRFVFDAKAISKLKADASITSCGDDLRYSVVEVVIAWIWRTQISATQARYGHLRPSLLSVAMNLRGKTFEKIPDNCCGNLFTLVTGRFWGEESKMWLNLNDLIVVVRDTIRKSAMEYAKPMKLGEDDELFNMVRKAGREIVEEFIKGGDTRTFASWRNFGIYQVDFGWGEPAWVSVAERPHKGVFLMDRKGGDGIEAWVTLDEEEMAFFQQDPTITNFSSS